MCSFARILVLEKCRPIETCERPVVPWKVRRDPVHDHADPSFMQCIDEELKVVRWSISTRRGEEAGNLVTPGRIKGMLSHRHELDMSKSDVFDVLNERLGELTIAEGFGFRLFAPRTEMDFINTDRRVQWI